VVGEKFVFGTAALKFFVGLDVPSMVWVAAILFH
jgi:hypothetical protein